MEFYPVLMYPSQLDLDIPLMLQSFARISGLQMGASANTLLIQHKVTLLVRF